MPARNPTVAGVILAAGSASRFGGAKLTAEVGGVPIVRRVVDAAHVAGLSPLIVVVGPPDAGEAESVLAAVADTQATVVVNQRAADGRGTSIAAGVSACAECADAVVILLADQPLVSAALVRQLVAAWRAGSGRIVRPVCGDVVGHPVLFDKSFIPALLTLDGTTGGNSVIRRHDGALHQIELADPTLLFDVDTPGDLERVREAWRRSGN